jgi:transcriptional regulator of acetoin/glycerol metabolism
MLLQNWKFYDTNVTKEGNLSKARYTSWKRSLENSDRKETNQNHQTVKEAHIKLQRYEFYHVSSLVFVINFDQ